MSEGKDKTLLVTIDFPPKIGGVAQYYANLVSKNPEQFLVLTDELKSTEKEIEVDFETVRRKLFFQRCWPHWLPIIFHLLKVLKNKDISQVWVGQVLPVGTACYLVSKIKKITYFVTCHGNDLLRAKQNKRKFWLVKKILQRADRVEVANELSRDILTSDFGVQATKIKVVWPELNIDKNKIDQTKLANIRTKLNLEDQKTLLTVSRLVESKRVGKVIEEFAKLVREDSSWHYLVVGDGPELTNLQNQVSGLGLDGQVTLIGQVEPQEMVYYYALADAFILIPGENSKGDTESFGIVFLEAQEFDLPIIATDFGGIKRAIGDYEKVKWVEDDSFNLKELLSLDAGEK